MIGSARTAIGALPTFWHPVCSVSLPRREVRIDPRTRRRGDSMTRRELILLLSGGMIFAPALRAQQKPMPVVGYLNISPPPPSHADLSQDLVHEGLSETGYVEGQN